MLGRRARTARLQLVSIWSIARCLLVKFASCTAETVFQRVALRTTLDPMASELARRTSWVRLSIGNAKVESLACQHRKRTHSVFAFCVESATGMEYMLCSSK